MGNLKIRLPLQPEQCQSKLRRSINLQTTVLELDTADATGLLTLGKGG